MAGNAQLKWTPLKRVLMIGLAVAERESDLTVGHTSLFPEDFVRELTCLFPEDFVIDPKRLNGLCDRSLENECEVVVYRLVCLKAHLRAGKAQIAGEESDRIPVEI